MYRHTLLLVSILLMVACSGKTSSTNNASQHAITYGLTLQPSGIDPHINASSELGIPLRQVYDTLVYRDPATKAFVPGLASSWEISPDGLTYTFKLRQDVKFHDGTSFNAQAVAVNLDRITNPTTASQKAVFMLGTYQSYEIVDDYTIRLKLSASYSPLLDSLSQVYLGIASPTALKNYSQDRYQFHQVGTGPFTFVEYVPGDRIVLRRNPDYNWGPPFYKARSAASVDEITFRFFTDPPSRLAAIENNQAQIMGELLPTDARALSANNRLRLIPVAVPGEPLQFLINTKQSPTDNLAVRQALLFATNRNAISDTIYQRFSPVAWAPIAANTLYYNRSLVGSYTADTAQAQLLLQSAGYRDTNADGYVDLNGKNLEVTVVVPPWGLIPQVVQLAQDQWRPLGVKVNLETVPSRNTLVEKVKQGNYNLVPFDTPGMDPALLNQFFVTNGSTNWSNFSSTDLDNLLIQASQATDDNVRGDLYAQAQKIIMDNALILPIRDYVNLNVARADIQNLSYDAYGWFPILNNVTIAQSNS
jgi:peptide/nickel transport system substrate-binding protein